MPAPQIFFADLVRESCTAGGTGPLVLDGALPGYRPFAGTVPVATLFHYSIAGVASPGQWEAGTGRIMADGRLERLIVAASSNAGAAVDFAPGAKHVTLTVGAAWFAGAGAPLAIADIGGLPAALDAKQVAGSYAVTGHGHAVGDVTGLQAALDGKQAAGSYGPAVHSHAIADVTGLQTALDVKMAVGAAFANGTAAAPTVRFAASTNSGLFSPGAAILSASTGGSERLRIAANGNVGIGSTSPARRLDVLGDGVFGAGTTRLTTYSDSSYSGLFNGASLTAAESLYMGAGLFYLLTAGATRLIISTTAMSPGADGTYNLGGASARWGTVFAASGTINTSDERDRADIGPIPDVWLDAWGAVDWQRYRVKGGKRWHVGLIAQRVHAAFAGFGIDAFAIGLLCRDAVKLARGRKDRWGLRYDECLAMEAAWQRREIARLSARLARRRIRKVAA